MKEPYKAYKAVEGEEEVIIALFTMTVPNCSYLYHCQLMQRTDHSIKQYTAIQEAVSICYCHRDVKINLQ